MLKQSTNQPFVREAAPKRVFKREGKLEINPLLLLAFGITPEEIGAVIKSAEEPEAMRDMFAFLSDYAALSDPRTRLSISGDKLDFLVADLKRRMAHVAEFYREQAIEYGKLVRFMDHVKVRKLQTADRLQRITEEARKLSAFSGQTRTDKVAFIDAVAHLEHTTGSVIPIAFGISDYGREDYWPRKLLAFLRTHGMPGMVRENVHADVPAPVPKKIPLQMTTGLPGLPPFGKIPPVIRPEKEAWQIPFEKFEHYVIYGHIAFTDSFRKFISEGYKISIQNRHHLLKPSKFGTVRQALSPEFVAIFPPQVLDNTEIYLATDIDNKYLSGALVSKISEGHYHIVMNPEQAGVDYVPLLFHEIKHVYDMVRGKSVAVTGIVGPEEFVEYKRLPSERRARRAEFAIIRAAHKNAVMKAIQEGKPVPPEVLAEYLGIAGAPAAVREAPAPAPDRGEPKINWNLNIREGRIVYMPPEEYMERINIFNRIGMSRVIEEEQRAIGRGYRGIGYYPPLSEQSYRSILEGIRAGNQIDIPNIVYRNGKVENHEGFHRALVARDIGIDKIPVQVIGEIPSSFSRALNLRWNENLTEQAKAINALKGKIMGGGSIIRESVAPEPANKEFKANPGLINKQAAYAAHIGTSFEPEKRGEQAIRGFAEEVQAVYERLKPHARTDAEKALLIAEMERFQAAYAQKYNDLLYAHSRIVSTMIAGPSKFPTERMRKINEAYDNKARETYEWKDRAEKAMLRALKGIAIEEAGGEVAVLKAKIAQAEKLQEMMVEGNKIVRKKAEPGIGGVSKQQQLINLGFTERQAAEALKPDFAGRLGFPSFALTNNSANIRRMKERLIELEKKEVTPTAEIPFTGGHIVDNRELDRVQIIFDQKPGQEVINKLKSEGWRWSPSNMAWQRKRTDYAMMSARRITGAAQPPAPAVPPVTPASPVVSPVVPPVQAPEERCIEYRLPLSKLKELALTIQSKYRLPNIYLGGSHSPKSSHYPKKDSDIDFTSYLWEYTEYVNYVHATPELSRLYEECRTAHACIARVAINGVKIHLRVEPIHTTFMPLEDQMILAGQMPIAPMLYPAPQPQAELRWVYGTQDMAWHLVGPEDRDYAHGITQERMRQIGQDAARAEYLSPSLARTAIPVPQVPTRMRVYVPPKPPLMLYPLLEAPRLPLPAPVSPEVRQYTTPRIFRKGTIARNKKTNEKFVLETEVEAYQQNKDATIWKTDEGHWIYLHEQLPAPTPPKHIIITPEDERLLKGYENYTDDAIQKRILLNEGKLKVLAARKLERIEQGKYGTMGSAYIEQERLGISQENSTFMRVLELRKLIAAQTRPEPWKLTQEEYWRAGAEGKAYEGRGTSDYTHKGQVVLALAQGKPVSPLVLKDYPDIVARIRQENEAIIAKERAERERIKAIERAEENELNAELIKLPPPLKRHAETEIYSILHLPETHKDYRNRFYIALGKVRSIAFAHIPHPEPVKEVPEPTGYFSLRKAQDLIRENNSKLSDEQLHKKSIQLRDYIRFIETPDEYSRKTLVKGGYYAGVIDQFVTGVVPVDPWLHQNLKSTLDEVDKVQQRRKQEKEKISVPTVPIAKPVTGKFVQTTFQVQERMRRYGYA